jgi:hypothetical protein
MIRNVLILERVNRDQSSEFGDFEEMFGGKVKITK